MKKFLMIVAIAFTLVGCDNTSGDRTYKYEMPQELSDCHVYRIRPSGSTGTSLYVVRCPNSNTSTSYSSGKTRINTSVVDE